MKIKTNVKADDAPLTARTERYRTRPMRPLLSQFFMSLILIGGLVTSARAATSNPHHSLGSGIAIVEAAQYSDVDGVILTGFLHAAGPAFASLGPILYPAQNDPRFAGQNLPDGYLTTLPGTRSPIFWTPNVEPEVMAVEDFFKETITTGELNTFPPLVFSPNNAQGIHVPVLIVIGQYDNIFCTPPRCPEAQVEPSYYSPEAQVEVKVIPNAGHALNLHRNAPAVFATVLDWSNRRFGN